MVSRITGIFNSRIKNQKKVNIAYLTPEYPFAGITVDLALMLSQNNVQIIEIGVPFSDPLADGPTIQNSSFQALQRNVTLKSILKDIKTIRSETAAGIVLMTYVNPVLSYGIDAFLSDAEHAGVDGLIIPDLPVEEIDFIENKIKEHKIDLILLAAPTSPPERLKKIASHSSGFIYCVSVTGVTGIRKSDYIESDTISFLESVKSVSDLPLALGFGLSEKSQLEKMSPYTDGFIIGSALIKSLEQAGNKKDALKSAQNFIQKVFGD
jgi:tryptophan synthase alpha chain